jgi:hypothetical protein
MARALGDGQSKQALLLRLFDIQYERDVVWNPALIRVALNGVPIPIPEPKRKSKAKMKGFEVPRLIDISQAVGNRNSLEVTMMTTMSEIPLWIPHGPHMDSLWTLDCDHRCCSRPTCTCIRAIISKV